MNTYIKNIEAAVENNHSNCNTYFWLYCISDSTHKSIKIMHVILICQHLLIQYLYNLPNLQTVALSHCHPFVFGVLEMKPFKLS